MKKLLIIGAVALLGGCSMMDVQEVGNKTTTYYDQSGVKTHDVTEAVMIGDKYTEYGKLASDVADSARAIEASRVKGILAATATKEGDSKSDIAWKSATATVAITLGATKVENAIKSLYYGKDRYDNADTGINAGASVTTAGVHTVGIANVVSNLADSLGDTSITADNGSTVSTNQEEIHSQTTGENSAPTVTVDKSDNTADPAIVEVPIDTAGVE